EAGARYQRGGLEFELTGFVNRLSDAIANVTLGHGPGLFPGVGFVAGDFRQRQNVDAVRVRGIEASSAARRGPWQARLGASYTHARVEASGAAADLDGLRPAQTPNFVVSGELGWSDRNRSASLLIRHASAQYEDDLNQLRLPPATTIDAFVAWPLTRRVQLIARGENLLNTTVVAGADTDGTVEKATPRTLWIGFRLTTL
ncbi:MAG TPA: TonB-dependent receptor, partial [Sphingomicrobium sp.]|nr:TonB-dependent receptor [Sphingomicrobium sp.]